jgi:hypothetical protein
VFSSFSIDLPLERSVVPLHGWRFLAHEHHGEAYDHKHIRDGCFFVDNRYKGTVLEYETYSITLSQVTDCVEIEL